MLEEISYSKSWITHAMVDVILQKYEIYWRLGERALRCYGGRWVWHGIQKVSNVLKIAKKKVCYGGHYIIPQSQFWHLATQLSTTNEHFISDLDFPNSHYIFIHFEKPFRLHFPIQRMNENYVYLNPQIWKKKKKILL